MNIITVSREFGSGGRELGRHIAQQLGYDYYDREIITAIANNSGLDEAYIEHALETHSWQPITPTLHRTMTSAVVMHSPQISLLLEQKQVIEEIGKVGHNCVIVGRNADILLEDYHPFNLFVCADLQERIERCIARAAEGESTDPKEITKKIKRIDKNRARTREILSDSPWGRRDAYHLIVNTTGWDLPELSDAVCQFALKWFEK